MEKFKKYFFALLFIVLGGLCIYFFLDNNNLQNKYYEALDKSPDTVFVPKPYKVIKIEKEYVARPDLVEVYKPDTLLRDSLEKGNIIAGVEIEDKFLRRPKLKIHTITPQGSILVNTYNAKDFKEIQINPEGEAKIKRKKKTFKKLAIVGFSAALISSVIIFKTK